MTPSDFFWAGLYGVFGLFVGVLLLTIVGIGLSIGAIIIKSIYDRVTK